MQHVRALVLKRRADTDWVPLYGEAVTHFLTSGGKLQRNFDFQDFAGAYTGPTFETELGLTFFREADIRDALDVHANLDPQNDYKAPEKFPRWSRIGNSAAYLMELTKREGYVQALLQTRQAGSQGPHPERDRGWWVATETFGASTYLTSPILSGRPVPVQDWQYLETPRWRG